MVRDTLHDLHRSLSDTGLAVLPLGLGTIKFGRDQGMKYPSGFTIPDDHETADLLALARDLSINLIDTALAYGRSEGCPGPLLRGQRKHWVIVSKVGEEFVGGQSVFDFSATRTWCSVGRSLERLGTEQIELVLMHSDGNDLGTLESSEVYPVPVTLKREGLIGAYGLSGETVEGDLHALREGDYAMVTYNLNRRTEHPVIKHAVAHIEGILAKKTLASGYACLDAGQDPMRVNFELVFDQPGVAAAIIGTIDPPHLVRNVAMVAQTLKKA